MAERHVEKTCRDCKCSGCEPTGTAAFAERVDAWEAANSRLTEAAKNWPKDGENPPTVDGSDVLILAHWFYTGEQFGGAVLVSGGSIG